MAAIEGTSRFRSCWLPERMMPPPARISSGSRKLKNAALGLRQNMRRSSRYWRHPSTIASGIGGQLQVHVLECRTPDEQVVEPFAPRQRRGRQLGQQRRRVVGVVLHEVPRGVAVGDAIVPGGPVAELA